jgi:TolB protein
MPRALTGFAVLMAAVVASVLAEANAGSAEVARQSGTIAFLRFSPSAWNGNAAETSLFTIRADGSHLRRLTPLATQVYAYEWSPDGRRIAYTDSGGSLSVVRSNGTGRRRLASSLMRSFSLSWSPDGKSIAVVSLDPADRRHTRLYVMSADRGKPRLLPPVNAQNAEWSPSGDAIAYSTGTGRDWLVGSGGGEPRPLDRQPIGYVVGWSPDGARLLVGHNSPRGRYSAFSVANVDGSDVHLLTRHAYNEYGAAWSPDGQHILYGREDREGIYVIGADGSRDHRLTRDSPIPVGYDALAWAPDGRSISYDTDRTGDGDIYAIDVNGRNRVRLTSSADVDVAPSWKPR